MSLTAFKNKPSIFLLEKKRLTKLKLKAIRSGVWFRLLPRIDRALVDLTIMVTSKIHSLTLAKNIFAIVRKLEEALENNVLRALREVGFPLARKLGLIAQRWGNVSAESWPSDISFARYLAITNINNPKMLKL